jgi:monofunctional biosynthetic peptidoglycan transglycosylase
MARRSLFGIAARGVLIAGLALLCAFAALLLIDSAAPPISTLMIGRVLEGKGYQRLYVRLKDISPALVAAVIASEDASFCHNDGVDWRALYEVMHEGGPLGPTRGASTITMQTAKNLFLWPGRSKLRKGIEIGIALLLGKAWSKTHTIEVYLNIAEWGDGLYGAEAAARRYFHKPARQLDAHEAALLATSLPNPVRRDAAHPSSIQRLLAAGLRARARRNVGGVGCLP